MSILSIEEQFALFRPTIGLVARLHYWFLGGATLGLIAAVIFWHPVPLMIAAFLGIVGVSEQRTGPNIVAAIAAYDSDIPRHGEVGVRITCWDSDNHYHATVYEEGQLEWEYEFKPQGWQPTQRNYPAQIWRADSSGRPILVVVDDGILIPRYEPKQLSKQTA